MFSPSPTLHSAPNSPLKPIEEQASTSTHTTERPATRLSREDRQQFLNELHNSVPKVLIPIPSEKSIRDALTQFQDSTEFKTLARKTSETLDDILKLAQQECTPKTIHAMKISFGTFVAKMKFPRQYNPWFEFQSPYEQRNPLLHSTDEMIHSYQSSCPQIQKLGKLIHAAQSGKLGIPRQQANEEIKPFLNELPKLISVCGAGSLQNIEELLKNITNQLLPGDLNEQYDNQVDLVVRENIRKILLNTFQNDLHHEINEIHRTLALRKLSSSLLEIKDISIEEDPHAKTFLTEINRTSNTSFKQQIENKITNKIKPKIEPTLICTALAETYLDKIRTLIHEKGIQSDRIPHSSTQVEKAIEALNSEYGNPPKTYLLGEVDRKDHSRCITQSTDLLAAWFLHKLEGKNEQINRALQNLKTHTTNTTETAAPNIQYPHERIYQTGKLCWTIDKNPVSERSEQVTIESFSKNWLKKSIYTDSIDDGKMEILTKAIINTSNNIRLSDSNQHEIRTQLDNLLGSPECARIGLNALVGIPAEFFTSEDKILCLMFMQIANSQRPETNPLLQFILPQATIQTYGRSRSELREIIANSTIEKLNKNPELVSEKNPAAKKFIGQICRDYSARSSSMKRHNNLLAWAFENKNANLTQLILTEQKKTEPTEGINTQLSTHFYVTFPNKKTPRFTFPNWPIELQYLKTNPLGVAAIQNDLALMRVLIEAGADVNTADQYGHTALSYAAAYGSTEMVNTLLDHNANPNGTAASKKHSTIPPLLAATLAEKINMIDLLVDRGADINKASHSNKLTPLHAAYKTRNLLLIKKLYSKGAEHDSSKGTFFDSSPFSKKQSPIEMVNFQLRNARNEQNKISQSELIKQYAQVYVLHHIENKMRFPEKPLVHGYPLVHALSYQHNLPTLKMMMDHLDATPSEKATLLNSRSSKGTHHKTPLMVAAKQGAEEVAQYLLSHPETDIALKNSKGRTALDIAEKYGHSCIVNLIQQHTPSAPPSSPVHPTRGSATHTLGNKWFWRR